MPDEISAREAGRLGGMTTFKNHGPEFYQEIGRKGGVAARKKAAAKLQEVKEDPDDGGRQEPT
jgi:general stress protein YciG